MNSDPHRKISTLLQLLQYRSSDESGTSRNSAFTYLADGVHVSAMLTFKDLDQQARQLAAHIQKYTEANSRVLIVYPPGIEYIVAFFACAYAGVIAVPALPPANLRTLPRLKLMAYDAQPSLALAEGRIVEGMREFQGELGDVLEGLTWLSTDNLPDISNEWVQPDLQPSDTAFLQYTSGSTGDPKGVVISHANLIANALLCEQVYGIRSEDVFVSWLPPHHDFGLVGAIVFPVLVGCHSVQFPPAVFLKRPYCWLKLLTDYRARMTGAPNFAYEMCIARISEVQKRSLDLSALDIAVNGAERIRAETLRRFSAAFNVCGFRDEAFTPAYGLAESTLLVSANPSHSRTKFGHSGYFSRAALQRDEVKCAVDQLDAFELVSVGASCDEQHQVIIVDPVLLGQQKENRVGEIWIRGPSVARGYWNKTKESQRSFFAKCGSEDDAYLRTGDLGFISDKELYVTGRIKEMMIFSGRNIYPQDIEATVEKIDVSFRVNGCAAFSLDDGDFPRLVIIQEIESRIQPNYNGLEHRIRAAIAEQHEVFEIGAIVLTKAGHLPRTSSGKVQRARCRDLFLANAFSCIWAWKNDLGDGGRHGPNRGQFVAPEGARENLIAVIWQDLLSLDQVGRHDNFFELGGHSLLAVQLASRVRKELGAELPLRDLFAHPTLSALAQVIGKASDAVLPTIVPADRGVALPLSFAQQRLWFLDQLDGAAGAAYHMPAGLRLQGDLNDAVLRATLDRIVLRHESLRTTFVMNDKGEPTQVFAPAECGFALTTHELSDLVGHEQEAAVSRISEDEFRAPFDLATGPLMRGRLLRLSQQEHILLITQHHVISDGWSIGVLVKEFRALYTAFSQGLPDPLPPLLIQYADYAAWERDWLQGEALQRQIDFWQQHLVGAPALLEVPTDRPRPAVQSYIGNSVALSLSAELTTGLRELTKRHGATLFMTLLAGWSSLLSRMSGQTDVVVGTPFANRQRGEVEPLIGFFVNTLALRVQVDDDPSVAQLIDQIKAKTLDAYAHQDIPFEQVVDIIKPPRSLSHSPIFQAMLALNNTPDRGDLILPGLKLSPLPAVHTNAHFDLSLFFVRVGRWNQWRLGIRE